MAATEPRAEELALLELAAPAPGEDPMGTLRWEQHPLKGPEPPMGDPMGTLRWEQRPLHDPEPPKEPGEDPMGTLRCSQRPLHGPEPAEEPGEDPMGTLRWEQRPLHDPEPPKEPGEDPMGTLRWEQRPLPGPEPPEAPTGAAQRASPDGGHDEAHVALPMEPRCILREPRCIPREPCCIPREPCCIPREPHSPRHHSPGPKQPWAPPVPTEAPGALEEAAAPGGRPCGPCAAAGGAEGPRAVAAALGALLLCPCLLYGAYVFLPFDAPLLPGAAARLLYTLRCAAFGTVPVVLGMLVHGVSRLCWAARPPCAELRREVRAHGAYVTQSVHLFILYFFNVAVLATYLPQEALKLIPLLTGLFAISRLIYWLLSAVGRSFRAFGLGLTFVPLLAMLLCNLYGMFVLEPDAVLAVAGAGAAGAPKDGARLRFWG